MYTASENKNRIPRWRQYESRRVLLGYPTIGETSKVASLVLQVLLRERKRDIEREIYARVVSFGALSYTFRAVWRRRRPIKTDWCCNV